MALVHCPECQHQVSTQATTCPGCGYPLQLLQQTRHEPDSAIDYLVAREKQRQKRQEENRKTATFLYLVLMVVVIIVVFASLAVMHQNQYHTCTINYVTPGSKAPPNGVIVSSSIMNEGNPCP